MKKIIQILFGAMLLINLNLLNAQDKKANPIIKQIGFNDGKISLNKKVVFYYFTVGNDFIIKDLKDNEIIKGSITHLGDNKFSNIITFVPLNKQLYSEKIIGRKQLFFALCKDNVINENFEIDEVKLNHFIEENNDSK